MSGFVGPNINVDIDDANNIVITDEKGEKKTVFANQLYDVDPMVPSGKVTTTEGKSAISVTEHNQIIRILDILKDSGYSRISIQTALDEPRKDESTKFEGVYDKYPDDLQNPEQILHQVELAVTKHFLDSINPIDWLTTTDTTDVPETVPLSPPRPTRPGVTEFMDAAKSISDIMIVDRRCFNFATEVVDPATRARFVEGRDIFFPNPGTKISISEKLLTYLGLKRCSVWAKRNGTEVTDSKNAYDFNIKVGSFLITKDTETLYNMNIFAGNTVKNIFLKVNFAAFFANNPEKFDNYTIPDGKHANKKIGQLRETKHKDFPNEYRRAYFAIKQAMIIAKEMGDLFQVLFMLVWCILNPNDDYSMATPDIVVFITCLLYQVNCVLTGVKCPFYSHFLTTKGNLVPEYIKDKILSLSTKKPSTTKKEDDEDDEKEEEGETHIYCELEFKKGSKIDKNVITSKIIAKNLMRISSCETIKSLNGNYSIKPQELDMKRILTRDPRIYTGGFMKVLIINDATTKYETHTVRIIVLSPRSSKKNYRLVFADLTESDATAVEIDEFINNPILVVSDADKQKWIKEAINNSKKMVEIGENYTLSNLGMTAIRNSTLNLKEFITHEEYADETTKNKSTLPDAFFDTMIDDIKEINKQLTDEVLTLTSEISHEQIYNLNRKFEVLDIFRCVLGFTDVFDMIPLKTYTDGGNFFYGFTNSPQATPKPFYDVANQQGLWVPLQLPLTEDEGVSGVVGKPLAKKKGDFPKVKTEQAAAQRTSSRNPERKQYTGMGGGNPNSLNMISYNDTIKYWKYEERNVNIKQDIFPIDNLIEFVDKIYETDENGLLTYFEKGLFNYDGSISKYGFHNPLAVIFNNIYKILQEKESEYYYNQAVSYFFNIFDIHRQFMSIYEMEYVVTEFVNTLPSLIAVDLPPVPTIVQPTMPPLPIRTDEEVLGIINKRRQDLLNYAEKRETAQQFKSFMQTGNNPKDSFYLGNRQPIPVGRGGSKRKTVKKHKYKRTIKKNRKPKRNRTIKHKKK